MKIKQYNRTQAISYAEKWAFSRNPAYYNFDPIGGDCTNFISQCIYSGSNVMNFNNINGWYYKNGYNRSPSWSGVEFLYKFLTTNKSVGPFGLETEKENIQIGDVVQLSFSGNEFQHSTIVVNINSFELNNIYIASHTFDSFNKPLIDYNFKKIRFIHIENVRFN